MVLGLATTAWAQDRNVSLGRQSASKAEQSEPADTLTGKERLRDKASDEQRVDDCKVPLDKRGPRLRPDSCDHDHR